MMPALTLEYCRRPVFGRAGLYALFGTLAFAAHVTAQYWSLREEVAAKEALLSAAAQRVPRPAMPQPVDAQEYAFARDTIERLAMPWSALFGALEAANTERVALLSIEPRTESRTVTLTGEARDYLTVLTYVARLADEERLKRVHLLRHETKRDAPRKPIVFTISAGWKDEP